MAYNQAEERQKRLRVPVQAHFMPPLKITERMSGVIKEPKRTIVTCTFDDEGKIIVPPVIQRKNTFRGEPKQTPEFYLFTSEAGGPQPTLSSKVEGDITGWGRGFSRIICGLGGEKLAGFVVPPHRVKLQGQRVRFRAKEFCRIDVRYSKDGKVAFLTISQHQIVGEEKGEPHYNMEVIFETKLEFSPETSYVRDLKLALKEAGLEHFKVPATTAVELGYTFPNGVKPMSPAIRDFSNKQRATSPVYLRIGSDEPEEAEATDTKKSSTEVAKEQTTTTEPKEKKKTTKKTTAKKSD